MSLAQIKHRPQLKGFVRAGNSARRRVPLRMTQRYAQGLGVDQPLVAFSGAGVGVGNVRYLYADRQGSIIALADSSGAVTQKYSYGPWGEPNSWTGSRFRYTGQTALPEANLYYYKARVYDPKMGRFLQTDPIGSKDDLDLYAYTGGDPVNKSDPTGNCPLCGDIIQGTLDGLGMTGQASVTANLGVAEIGVGVYAGRGPNGDFRVGVNLTSGPQVGNDISVSAGGTLYAGDTSNVRGYASEVSVSTTVGGVTGGYTTANAVQAAPDKSSVAFVGASVGPAVAPVSVHASKTVTVAADTAVAKSPLATAISTVVKPVGEKVRNNVNNFVKDPAGSFKKMFRGK